MTDKEEWLANSGLKRGDPVVILVVEELHRWREKLKFHPIKDVEDYSEPVFQGQWHTSSSSTMVMVAEAITIRIAGSTIYVPFWVIAPAESK